MVLDGICYSVIHFLCRVTYSRIVERSCSQSSKVLFVEFSTISTLESVISVSSDYLCIGTAPPSACTHASAYPDCSVLDNKFNYCILY